MATRAHRRGEMSGNARRLHRLRTRLAELGATDVDATTDRVGAVLVLLEERDDDLVFVLTLRRDDLPTHPGQVSFPGGRRESWETTRSAALREAAEEIGLRASTVEVVGRLPAFFIPPSRFWMAPVVARWHAPHPLKAQESEVAAIVHAPLSALTDRSRWRKVRLSASGWSWAWALDGDHILWGATGMVVTVLLDVLEPAWRAGTDPGDLPDEQEVMPWLDPRLERRGRPARLSGTATRPRHGLVAPGPPTLANVDAAGRAVSTAVGRLPEPAGHIVVLAGTGGTGAVGLAAARDLAATGARVTVVAAGADPDSPAVPFTGTLPGADLFIDALVGGGQQGRLRGTPLEIVLGLRAHAAPILSVDLPSGVHPTEGLIGDAVSATVTVALDGMWPALGHVGLSPFVGDLYLWRPGSDDVVRLVGGPERTTTAGGWRE
jgi:NAD(P)H-hydrate repair Nnr-like enzyme with NAD(P)H-hydrate epimerase domain/8-oxo-dGTP pyrophosphatase MutT (NUDIX family)